MNAQTLRFGDVWLPANIADWGGFAATAAAEAERRTQLAERRMRANELGTAAGQEIIRTWCAIYHWFTGDPNPELWPAIEWAKRKGGWPFLAAEIERATRVAGKTLQDAWGDVERRPALEKRYRGLHALNARAKAMLADNTPTAEMDRWAFIWNEG